MKAKRILRACDLVDGVRNSPCHPGPGGELVVVEFREDYNSTDAELTGEPQPRDGYERETPGADGTTRTEGMSGRIFRAKAGDAVELTEAQAALIRRITPSALADPKPARAGKGGT